MSKINWYEIDSYEFEYQDGIRKYKVFTNDCEIDIRTFDGVGWVSCKIDYHIKFLVARLYLKDSSV